MAEQFEKVAKKWSTDNDRLQMALEITDSLTALTYNEISQGGYYAEPTGEENSWVSLLQVKGNDKSRSVKLRIHDSVVDVQIDAVDHGIRRTLSCTGDERLLIALNKKLPSTDSGVARIDNRLAS